MIKFPPEGLLSKTIFCISALSLGCPGSRLWDKGLCIHFRVWFQRAEVRDSMSYNKERGRNQDRDGLWVSHCSGLQNARSWETIWGIIWNVSWDCPPKGREGEPSVHSCFHWLSVAPQGWNLPGHFRVTHVQITKQVPSDPKMGIRQVLGQEVRGKLQAWNEMLTGRLSGAVG